MSSTITHDPRRSGTARRSRRTGRTLVLGGLVTTSLAGLVPTQFASNATYEATRGRGRGLRRSLVLTAWLGVAGAAGLALVGRPLLVLGYGRAFDGSYAIMVAALPGVVAYGLLQVFTNRMRIVGRAADVTVPSAVGALVMVVGLLVATPLGGGVGAATASSLGALSAVAALWLRWRAASRTGSRPLETPGDQEVGAAGRHTSAASRRRTAASGVRPRGT